MSDKIKLTPLTRLTMTFDRELSLDSQGLLRGPVFDGLLENHRVSVQRRDHMLKALVIANSVRFLLLNGHGWRIPGFDLDIASLPAVFEITSLYISVGFLFLCIAFVNEQCYSGIINQYGIKDSGPSSIDPDFVNASKQFTELFLKLYRPKMNIWGADFFISRRPFAWFSGTLTFILLLVLALFPLLHFLMIWGASMRILDNQWGFLGQILFIAMLVIINLAGVVMVAFLLRDFSFDLLEAKEEAPIEGQTPKQS
ncbi:hypothetical protein [Tabrizicola sp.]|uniref:hypothetical protein n=1 Tax=Tabrizicola sp. TaxID=2005166 RepID=UPI001A62B898|nr:hypothetical protein [Tabrizicola sp.]MBL9075846.1 hypothetical protein [Tabrizicola sp.]